MEAKLDDVSSAVQTILRMVVSLTTLRTNVCADVIASNFLSIFPLKTEESLAKFGQNLSDSAYRNDVVISVFIYLLCCKLYATAYFAALEVECMFW